MSSPQLQNIDSGVTPRSSSKKLLATGLLAGAAAGAWATNRLRNSEPTDDNELPPPKPIVDWEQARTLAINMNRGAALTATERSRLDQLYQRLTEQCIPMVGDYMGVDLPSGTGQSFAFDRVDWINANIDAFRHMLTPLEPLLTGAATESGRLSATFASANRRIVAAELGVLLGYLARRVLGQYDVALLGRERVESSKLYYVEPNIAQLETTLRLPGDEFRMWLALHETTHVFQFEAFPWVRPHFNAMLERYFEYLQEDAKHLTESVKNIRIFVDRARNRSNTSGSWIEALMNDEQRALFSEMQALMSIIEGYSNHVMNVVSKELLPNYATISKKFEVRQRNRSNAEQLFAKITGLDLKIEQYRQGQQFVDAIVARHGHAFALRLWESPDAIPTLEELRDPEAWVTRMSVTPTIETMIA